MTARLEARLRLATTALTCAVEDHCERCRSVVQLTLGCAEHSARLEHELEIAKVIDRARTLVQRGHLSLALRLMRKVVSAEVAASA